MGFQGPREKWNASFPPSSNVLIRSTGRVSPPAVMDWERNDPFHGILRNQRVHAVSLSRMQTLKSEPDEQFQITLYGKEHRSKNAHFAQFHGSFRLCYVA